MQIRLLRLGPHLGEPQLPHLVAEATSVAPQREHLANPLK
jgi:hypothetical protein